MKNMYRPIGDFIRIVDIRNKEMRISRLMGLSIDKCYIPSVANVIGTDLSNYKIISRRQFACSLMQVSRDEKIPIACMTECDEAIMSPAYTIFEVIDCNIVLPEYLNLWFARTEFDREASFLAVGGIRGNLSWEDFCQMKFPLIPICEQKAIVDAYKSIVNRISLLRMINDNLAA
jgi:type I restriction enzyme S subunit